MFASCEKAKKPKSHYTLIQAHVLPDNPVEECPGTWDLGPGNFSSRLCSWAGSYLSLLMLFSQAKKKKEGKVAKLYKRTKASKFVFKMQSSKGEDPLYYLLASQQFAALINPSTPRRNSSALKLTFQKRRKCEI